MILETLKWRHRLQLHLLTPANFPQEFYRMGGLYECGPDRFGLPIICIRAKSIRKVELLDPLLGQFLAFRLFQLEQRLKRLESWTLLFDCSDVGFANVNFWLIKFLIDLLRLRFPLSLRYAIVLEVPFLLNAVQRLVMAMLPEDNKRLVHFVNRRQLLSYVDSNALPKYLNGNCYRNFAQVPSTCQKNILQICSDRFNLPESEIIRLCKPYLEPLASLESDLIGDKSLENVSKADNLMLDKSIDTNNNVI